MDLINLGTTYMQTVRWWHLATRRLWKRKKFLLKNKTLSTCASGKQKEHAESQEAVKEEVKRVWGKQF